MYASRSNFAVSTADFFNQQQNFTTLLCLFFKSIFESWNLRVVTKTTFAKIAITWQWKVITRWNYDHWCRIDHRSHFAAWLRTATGSFAIRTELSVIFGQPLYFTKIAISWLLCELQPLFSACLIGIESLYMATLVLLRLVSLCVRPITAFTLAFKTLRISVKC